MVHDAVGQRSQPQPPRVRCRARPFFWSRGRGFLARSDETGALRASEDLLMGLLNIPRGLRDHAAERPMGATPVPNASARSGRCRARARVRAWQVGRRKASGPEIFAQQKCSGRVAGGQQRLLRPIFGRNGGAGGLHSPQSDEMSPKIGLGRRGRASGVGNPPFRRI